MLGTTFGLPQYLCQLDSANSKIKVTHNELNLDFLRRTKNTCSGYAPNNLEKYGIVGTGATQNFIRINTPCSNKQPIKAAPKSYYPTAAS